MVHAALDAFHVVEPLVEAEAESAAFDLPARIEGVVEDAPDHQLLVLALDEEELAPAIVCRIELAGRLARRVRGREEHLELLRHHGRGGEGTADAAAPHEGLEVARPVEV